MEKVNVMNGVMDVERVISRKSERCLACGLETENCAKLYKHIGSNATMCVEM